MRRLVALVFAVALVAGAPVGVSASPAAHHVDAGKKPRTVNATFGAAPSTAKGPDGRPYFTFDTTPDGRLTDHLAITNSSYKPERLNVYPVDAVPAVNGTISFQPRSAPRTQAGAWLAVGTPGHTGEITVAPRSTDILPVRIIVPRNAPPGDHVGAVIVSLSGLVSSRFGQGSKQHVKFEQRIAVRAVFRVTGPVHPFLGIEALKASYDGPIDPFAKGSATVSYTVHNGGNVVLGGPQTVTIHGLLGESVVAPRMPVIPPLLPGASYPVSVRIPGIYPELLMSAKVSITPAGLQGEIDPGLHPVTSSVHFLAIPWIVLVVLLILILGLCSAYVRRRRRRRVTGPESDVKQPQGVRT